jgi:hypothetical protein
VNDKDRRQGKRADLHHHHENRSCQLYCPRDVAEVEFNNSPMVSYCWPSSVSFKGTTRGRREETKNARVLFSVKQKVGTRKRPPTRQNWHDNVERPQKRTTRDDNHRQTLRAAWRIWQDGDVAGVKHAFQNLHCRIYILGRGLPKEEGTKSWGPLRLVLRTRFWRMTY